MEGDREDVAARLTKLVGLPDVSVSADDKWMPYGKPILKDGSWDKTPANEARLDKANCLVESKIRNPLRTWWLARRGNTPNWDIASTCNINGEPGLILVEAKAHDTELTKPDNCGSKNCENVKRICKAISEANRDLQESCQSQLGTKHDWRLSNRGHYQLSNRFAWSWKLASLGVPVVLVYLGFLNAYEMIDKGCPFQDTSKWERVLKNYGKDTVNNAVWGERLYIGEAKTPFIPLIRACDQDFDPKNP